MKLCSLTITSTLRLDQGPSIIKDLIGMWFKEDPFLISIVVKVVSIYVWMKQSTFYGITFSY